MINRINYIDIHFTFIKDTNIIDFSSTKNHKYLLFYFLLFIQYQTIVFQQTFIFHGSPFPFTITRDNHLKN